MEVHVDEATLNMLLKHGCKTALRLCRDKELAEDVVQDALIRLLGYLPKLRLPEPVDERGWFLMACLNNLVFSILTNKRRRQKVARTWQRQQPPDEEAPDAGPEFLLERRQLLEQAIASLRGDQRRIFVLRIKGHELHEIAEMLGMPRPTVSTHLRLLKQDIVKNFMTQGLAGATGGVTTNPRTGPSAGSCSMPPPRIPGSDQSLPTADVDEESSQSSPRLESEYPNADSLAAAASASGHVEEDK
jgi:RNA polymerase sigma factor (sigma-70 family)